jgi:hypothetical protein
MRLRLIVLLSLLIAAAVLIGCGTNVSTYTPSPPPAAALDARYVLAEEPADAQPVIAVRNDAKDGDEVTITGRIGGDKDPWIQGRAAFLIVDLSLPACTDRPGDTCETPWDYCCEEIGRLNDSKATIKIVDEAGNTVPTDARQLLGVKELQTVTIRGQAKRDDAGNLTVLAKSVYVKR